jgi:hypothetical protein
MEEELDLKVIRVLIDPETFENLISEQPDQDLKTELTSYFSNSEAICHLQSRCSQDGGFIVTITDCDEELIDQFIFSPEEMHDLQK